MPTSARLALSLLAIGVLLLGGAAAVLFLLDSDDAPGGGAAASGPRIRDITLARGVTPDFQPVGPTFTFPTDVGQIWAVLTIDGVDRRIEVVGTWSYLGPLGRGSPVRVAQASVQADPVANPVRRSAINVGKPEPFDAGIYRLEVALNGEIQKVVEFTIATPTQTSLAPTATFAPGARTPTPPAQAGDTYVVQPGDTLSQLAERWGVTVAAIADLNGLANTSLIVSGQVLHVPRPGQVIPTRTPTLPPASAPLPTATPVPPTSTPSATPVTPSPTATRTATPFQP